MTTLPYRPERDAVLPAQLRGVANGRIPNKFLAPCGIGSFVLVEPAAGAMRALVAAADADGVTIAATGTYRSYAQQEQLFVSRYTTTPLENRPTKNWNGTTYWQQPRTAMAAVPGTSNHGWGLAVDVDVTEPATAAWMRANAYKYGFVEAVPREPWHWEYRPSQA